MRQAVELVAILVVFALLTGQAEARQCFGQHATIDGTPGPDHIVSKARNDVIWAGHGPDRVKAEANAIVCGGHGSDVLLGRSGAQVLIGGPGRDHMAGGHAGDLMIGDNANPNGSTAAPSASDTVDGGYGADTMVGDNYAARRAYNAHRDGRPSPGINPLRGGAGNDLIVGDNYALVVARGGEADWMGGAQGDDTVVGDSYSIIGLAVGGGNDSNNNGPGADLAVGDSYSVKGEARGGGDDALHSADGGDAGGRCAPTSACDDTLYGDSHSQACGSWWLVCIGVLGGGDDLLTADQGADRLNGEGGHDRCAGGIDGPDIAALCEYVFPDVEVVLPPA